MNTWETLRDIQLPRIENALARMITANEIVTAYDFFELVTPRPPAPGSNEVRFIPTGAVWVSIKNTVALGKPDLWVMRSEDALMSPSTSREVVDLCVRFCLEELRKQKAALLNGGAS